MKTRTWSCVLLMAAGATLIAGNIQSAAADTLCVNPGGKSGCFAKIGDAVTAAMAGDPIQVAPGTYAEDVVIGKSLSLIGANSANTTINATGKGNGIYIDGLDAKPPFSPLSEVRSRTPISRASLSPMRPRSRFRTTAWSVIT